jgi:RNA polymerase sigma-70 factor (ECF subfamily)
MVGEDKAVLHGDLDNFDRDDFDRVDRLVRSFYKNRGFSDDEAADLSQETLMRVFANIDKLRDARSMGAWVLRIAANIYKNELRSRRTGKRDGEEISIDDLHEDYLVSQESNSLVTAINRERVARLGPMIKNLSPMQRACFSRMLLGFKYEEIADALRISVATVKAHVHQVRLRLAKLEEEQETSSGPNVSMRSEGDL